MTDTKTQTEKFKQMAKELQTNDDEKTFDSKLKTLANTKVIEKISKLPK